MHNILLAAVRLGSEAAVWRGSEKCEKSLEKFQQKSSFFSYGAVYRSAMLIKNELVHCYFSMILIGKLS